MSKVIQSTILMFIFCVLWARFFCMIWDPFWGQVDPQEGLSIYRDFRFLLDGLYAISGYLMLPVYSLAGWLMSIFPTMENYTGFKTVQVFEFLRMVHIFSEEDIQKFQSTATVRRAFVGYVDLLVINAIIYYPLAMLVFEKMYHFVKNIILNLFIEFSFTKRKESQYQKALSKRASELVKLNVQYKNLTKEASVLAKSVVTDELTQVYNKRFFLEKVAFEFKTAKSKKRHLTIVMVDIDHFKKLNDTYGHLMGDKVLKSVAQVVQASTPDDSFCCRFGGEEFSIIFPGYELTQALEVISEIHVNIPYLRFEESPELRTSASFGVCCVNFKAQSGQALTVADDLIKLADDELYKAKLNGRNRIESNYIA